MTEEITTKEDNSEIKKIENKFKIFSNLSFDEVIIQKDSENNANQFSFKFYSKEEKGVKTF